MQMTNVQRHYPIPELDFRDFWDICGHIKSIYSEYPDVLYTIRTAGALLIEDETDIGTILKTIRQCGENILSYSARFVQDDGETERIGPEVHYFFHDSADKPAGLTLTFPVIRKLQLYKLEDILREQYLHEEVVTPPIVFGTPCEVVAAMIDLRGFSLFCEQPNIESPYTCGLMYTFYQLVQNAFRSYPPDLFKFLGDGVLTLWQTTYQDRDVAIRTLIQGAIAINNDWQGIRRSPQFTHGAPEEVATGISFGLASKLPGTDDYIGRPINVASRLCSVCPGGSIFIDKSTPNVDPEYTREETIAHIKSFGRYFVWRIRAN